MKRWVVMKKMMMMMVIGGLGWVGCMLLRSHLLCLPFCGFFRASDGFWGLVGGVSWGEDGGGGGGAVVRIR